MANHREKKLLETSICGKKLFLDGWTSNTEAPADVTDKATGEVLGQVAVASAADVEKASELAAAATGWANTAVEGQAEIVRKDGALLRKTRTEPYIGSFVRRARRSSRPVPRCASP